jgi:hypothetical protein
VTEFELVKVIAQTFVQVREDGQIVGEILGEQVHCYTPEQLAAVWPKVLQEIEDRNALEHAKENGGGEYIPEAEEEQVG